MNICVLFLINFQKSILLYDSLALKLYHSFLVWLISSHILVTFHILPSASTWENLFGNHFLHCFLSSVFISMYSFDHTSWLNLMTLCTFSNTNLWFNACFTFLMCIKSSFYHVICLQVFQYFKFLFFQAK